MKLTQLNFNYSLNKYSKLTEIIKRNINYVTLSVGLAKQFPQSIRYKNTKLILFLVN